LITITRSLARQVRAIFKRTLNAPARRPAPIVCFQAGPEGLHIRATWSDAAAEYHIEGDLPPEEITVPLDVLAQCEGRRQDEVTLERNDNQIAIRWTDDGVPQLVQCEALEAGSWPMDSNAGSTAATNPPRLLTALADAMETADTESTRYATNKIQLRGTLGTIAATDGRQLLVQRGFTFPWDEDLLIPRTTVFQCKDLPQDQAVQVTKSGSWIGFQVGRWTIWLASDTEGRFPKVEDHIPSLKSSESRMQVSDTDAQFLLKSLRRLPVSSPDTQPITVDLNGRIAIRAQAESQPHPTELLLTGSKPLGTPVRINTNRRFLNRAMTMGFRELHLFGPTSPVLCQDRTREYLWALLDGEAAIKPNTHAVRIESPTTPVPSKPRTSRKRRSPTKMTTTHARSAEPTSNNGSAKNDNPGVEILIDQAEAIRSSLRETVAKTSALIAGLKRHRKHSKIVRSTLASLRQLQSMDA